MNSIMLPVTLATAGAAAIINFWLSMRTSAVRRSEKVSIGDGGNTRLIARMRAQANFVEYAPFILILIGLIEFTTGTSTWLWVVSAAFLLARIAHPLGMDGMPAGRTVGTMVTLVLLLGLAVYAVVLPFTPERVKNAPVESVLPVG
jgi:uncharacterized membrane protein YecN with MAPEG domain